MKDFRFYLAALFFAALFLVPIPVGPDRFFWKEFFDAGHVVLFFLLMILVHKKITSKENSSALSIASSGLVVFACSALIEALQPIFGRSSSWEDLLLGGLGILAACFTLSNRKLDKVLGVLAFIIFQVWGSIPALEGLAAIDWREKHFPLLADFESDSEAPMWDPKGKRSSERARHGSHSFKVETLPYPYTSYSAGAQNWNSFQSLRLFVFNPEKNVRNFAIRVDDSVDTEFFEDRFNKTFKVSPGWQEIVLPLKEIENGPLNRKLNLSHIVKIHFFSSGETRMSKFFLDYLLLDSQITATATHQ